MENVNSICVYSASSDAVAPRFFELATELGAAMAGNGHTLVYGGGAIGLMGAIARAIHAHGGRVVGVIPGFMRPWGVAYETADDLIVTEDMRERKAKMETMADAFIGLPGGFGTLEEMLEVITLKQLGRHDKPIVFINAFGFYDPLAEAFEHMFRENFAKRIYRDLYYFAPDVPSAMRYISEYNPSDLGPKWYDRRLTQSES